MTAGMYPPTAPGTIVKTTKSKKGLRGWTKEGLATRRWGVLGMVIGHHYSHGLYYDVQHADDTVGFYDPSEFEVIIINLDELQEETEKLLALLKDRQPGLSTWNRLLKKSMQKMHSLLS